MADPNPLVIGYRVGVTGVWTLNGWSVRSIVISGTNGGKGAPTGPTSHLTLTGLPYHDGQVLITAFAGCSSCIVSALMRQWL
jgi:hypothetical protein